MLTRIIYAVVATLAVIGNTAEPANVAVIICDAARSSTSPPADDLHDITGHHRYYGRSACIDSRRV